MSKASGSKSEQLSKGGPKKEMKKKLGRVSQLSLGESTKKGRECPSEVPCKDCRQTKPVTCFTPAQRTHSRKDWRCIECQFPSCPQCGKRPQKAVKQGGTPICCVAYCNRCKTMKGIADFSSETKQHGRSRWICRDCQFPFCKICKQQAARAVQGGYQDFQWVCPNCTWPCRRLAHKSKQ